MDKFQAAFEILYLLAIDGSVDEREIQEINAYINDNLGKSDYDTHATANALAHLTPEGKTNELFKAGGFLNDVCSPTDKINLLDFAYRVIVADGEVSEVEKGVFFELGRMWQIDIDQFLAERESA